MSLMGKAAMVAWHDLKPGMESEHDHWHSREHLFERVSIDGFRRGRRGRAIAAPEEYFLMYEVDDVAVLNSSAYLKRLNAPTAWSEKIIPGIFNMTRTFCRVRASLGGGLGSKMLSIRFSARAGKEASLLSWLHQEVLPSLAATQGIVGAHLLEGDEEASGVTTDETRLRGSPDRIAHLIFLIEGYDDDVLVRLSMDELSPTRFHANGTEIEMVTGLHHLDHVVTESDLPESP